MFGEAGGVDRRRADREKMWCEAKVMDGILSGKYCSLTDLSATGALLRGAGCGREGDHIHVILMLPTSRSLTLEALIVRRQGTKTGEFLMGIQFEQIGKSAQVTIVDAMRAAAAPTPGDKVALVVDGSPRVQAALAKELRSLGYHTVAASLPLQAIWSLTVGENILGSNRGIDMAVVGTPLGATSGDELARYMSRAHPGVQTVLLVRGSKNEVVQVKPVDRDLPFDMLEEPWTAAQFKQMLPAIR